MSSWLKSEHNKILTIKAATGIQPSSADSISKRSFHASPVNFHIDRLTGHIVLMATAIMYAQAALTKTKAIPI